MPGRVRACTRHNWMPAYARRGASRRVRALLTVYTKARDGSEPRSSLALLRPALPPRSSVGGVHKTWQCDPCGIASAASIRWSASVSFTSA
eukprot:2462432-Pleurochrysis_carterae.AAC.3